MFCGRYGKLSHHGGFKAIENVELCSNHYAPKLSPTILEWVRIKAA